MGGTEGESVFLSKGQIENIYIYVSRKGWLSLLWDLSLLFLFSFPLPVSHILHQMAYDILPAHSIGSYSPEGCLNITFVCI